MNIKSLLLAMFAVTSLSSAAYATDEARDEHNETIKAECEKEHAGHQEEIDKCIEEKSLEAPKDEKSAH